MRGASVRSQTCDAETATEVTQLKTGGPEDISSVEQIANTIEYALKVGKTPRFIMDAKGDNKQAAFQKNLEEALARWPESERDTIRKLVQAEYRDFPNLYG